MARKLKSDTVSAHVAIGAAHTKGLPQPTEELSAAALTHFNRLIRSKNVLDLSENDLTLMTVLARMQALQSEALSQVELEGVILDTEKGATVHPQLRAADVIAKAVAKYVSLLGMSASQRGVGSSAQAKARDRASAAAIKALDKASEASEAEDLI